jgi:hypothetical protein
LDTARNRKIPGLFLARKACALRTAVVGTKAA